MNVDAAGRSVQPPSNSQTLDEREAALAQREFGLLALQKTVEARSLAIEASLAASQVAARELESQAWHRADARRRVGLAMAELEKHNKALLKANEKLVMATLTAQELREAAQLARRRQEEFLAMLAHELRNPLAPISAAVEVLARLDDKPLPPGLLEIVRRQIKHLVRVVDDLLDVSRVTEGKVSLQKRTTAVADFVQHAVDTCREDIVAKDQRLTVELDPTPLFVDGDPVRLVQVLTNLLQNACKYTPRHGEISVSARRRGDWVEIRVRDNGTGITSRALPHVFDLFVQDDRQIGRTEGGLGIGLTVVRRMVDMHGGTVEARSAGRNLGSEFIVKLPFVELLENSKLATRAVAALAPTAARILIVEDNVDAAESMAGLLRLSDHKVDVALNGLSGVAQFEQTRPQVVLCDIGLPDIDGYEVVARMRKSQHEPRPALIAITGYGGAANAQRALSAGFDHHVVKPVNPEALLRLIDTAIQNEEWTTTGHGTLTGPKSDRPGRRTGQRS